MFQGDPAAWFAMLQAQWQVCDAYKLAGQVQLEAQQHEYTMSLQHQFESMCADLEAKGDTQALKVGFEQQLADIRRRAETSHAEQESATQRQKAEAERYMYEQRAAYDEEQRQRESNWNAERLRAEAILAEERTEVLQRPRHKLRPTSRKDYVWKSRGDYSENRIMPMLRPKMPTFRNLATSFENPS